MKRALVAISAASSLAACIASSGDEGLIILKNVAPSEGCVLDAREDAAFTSHGSLDSTVVSSYLLFPQIKSRITALAGEEDRRTVLTRGANISLSFPEANGPSLPESMTAYRTLFTAPISPNGGLTNTAIPLIPFDVAEAIAAAAGARDVQILATVTVDGDMSGSEVTSQPFSFPITMGRGFAVIAGPCPLAVDPSEILNTGNACNPKQDGRVTCCQAGEEILCPATTASPTP